MNIQFQQMDGKKYRSLRPALTQLLTNLVTRADIEKKNVSCSVSTGRSYKTDLPPEANGVQLRGNSHTEVTLTVSWRKTLYSVTITLKKEDTKKFLDFMRSQDNTRNSMPLLTGDSLFTKSIETTRQQQPQTPPTPMSAKSTPEPSKAPTTFNLNRDGISVAFLAIVEALESKQASFKKTEAYEWMVSAQIGILNNRLAGRVITAMIRAEVIMEQKPDTCVLTALGKKVASGEQIFPDVPPETRVRKKTPTTQEEQGVPEHLQDEFEPSSTNDVPQNPEKSGPENINRALEEFINALEQEAEARKDYFEAKSKRIGCREALAQHLPEATIVAMERLSTRV